MRAARRVLLLTALLVAALGSPAAAQVGSGLGAPTDGATDPSDGDAGDTGSADTGSADTGSADTGPADTGPADTGPAVPDAPAGADTAPPADAPDPTEGAGETEDEFEAPDAGEPERMRMLVVDAATFGIDPVVGRVASAQMRETGAEVGYQVLTQQETIGAAQQLQMPYPPTPADLWRVSWVARVHRGAFARIWAHAGQYVIEVTVASLDGAGPFFARGTSGADDLRQAVDRLLRTALPAPSVWNASAEGGGDDPGGETGPDGEPIDELDDLDDPGEGATGSGTDGAEAEAQEPEPELRAGR